MLPVVLGVVTTAGASLLALPSLVFTAEVLASFLPRRAEQPPSHLPGGLRVAVVVPAHDEAAGIGATVEHLRAQLAPEHRLIVVADNCSDATARLASEAGADVWERQDANQRGKGFALSFAMQRLAAEPPDVVVVMDADCRVAAGSLPALAHRAQRTDRPVQAVYLLAPRERGSDLSGISAFAFLVRNLIRPRGLARLGLPCQLTGTGMAFPWRCFRDAPPTHGFLVEDQLLGHELALLGSPPLLDEDTLITGDLPETGGSSLKQRRRWEHGTLSLMGRVIPRLLRRAVTAADLGVLALAGDVSVPPLALLVMVETASCVAFAGWALLGGPALPALVAAGGLGVLAIGVGAAWLGAGHEVLPLATLRRIPAYVLWKLPLYAGFARRGAHTEWERTDRPP